MSNEVEEEIKTSITIAKALWEKVKDSCRRKDKYI